MPNPGALHPGERIAGRFRIVRLLGRGGVGTTYLARDEAKDKDVALKIAPRASLDVLARELLALRGLYHPRLQRVVDLIRFDRGVALASSFVEGATLAEAKLPSWDALHTCLRDVASALAFLHSIGAVHGDVKADNVIVGGDGRATLIDLSCSRFVGAADDAVAATLELMAPERGAGRVAATLDVFSFGRCVSAIIDTRVLAKHVPASIRRLIEACVDPDPQHRPESGRALAEALGVRLESLVARTLSRSAFVGQDELLAEIERWTRALSERRAPRPALHVWGAPGAGKTRLLDEARWRAQPMMTVLERLAPALLASDPDAASLAAGELAKGQPILFVIDDLDRLDPDERRAVERVVRVVTESRNVGLLTSGTRALGDDARDRALKTLGITEIAEWLQRVAPHLRAPEILAETGGLPGLIAERIETSLGTASRTRESKGGGLTRGLTSDERRALALCVASLWPVPVEAFEAESDALAPLSASGIVRVDERGASLARPEQRTALAGELADELAAAHRRLLTEAEREGSLAKEICHRVGAGDDAADLLTRARAQMEHDARAMRPLAAAPWMRKAPELASFVASVLELAGEPHEALSVIASALRRNAKGHVAVELRHTAARAYAKLGHRRAVAALGRALDEASGDARARVAAPLAQLLLRRGAYGEALGLVERESDHALPADFVDLAITAAQAASYGAREDDARIWLERARKHASEATAPIRARLSHASALLALRAGDSRQALDHFARARDDAQGLGLGELFASASIGLGALAHKLGDWGSALAAYAAADRVAVALALAPQRLTLAFNGARLEIDIGRFERARIELDRAESAAKSVGHAFFGAACDALAAEIASATDDEASREASTRAAHDAFAALGASRELVEVDLATAQHHARRGQRALATESLARARARLGADPAPELECALLIGEGKLDGDLASGQRMLERALTLAERCQQRALVASAHAALADLNRARGLDVLAERERLAAVGEWEHVLGTLPRDARDAFVSHPDRAALFGEPTRMRSPEGGDHEVRRLRKLLAVNARLSSAKATPEVLEAAVDAAIELTDAEHGLVMLPADSGEVNVHLARSAGGRASTAEEASFSRGIATRTLASGQALISVDAETDARLRRNRSVHALKLKSVLAVPIRSGDSVLGVMCVFTRASARRLGPAELETVSGFADQVALALARARLMGELAAQNRALEAAREQNEALLRNQARRIAELEESTSAEPDPNPRFSFIVGSSPALKRVIDVVSRVADAEVPLLIRGESGTGKELVARALHEASGRRSGPFVAVNCGALPEALLEAELFGYAKGAFTGAAHDKLGLFVAADKGTLFLDEIGEMPEALQVKLLRVLQEREVTPLGTTKPRKFDARIVSATHRSLREEIARGRFREDIYYRIAVVEVEVPPLRERAQDIPALVDRIMSRLAAKAARPPKLVSPAAMRELMRARFPGNVRELENVISRAFFLTEEPTIESFGLDESRAPAAPLGHHPRGYKPEDAARMREALVMTGWNVAEAARLLKVPRVTFYRRMRRYGLEPPRRG